VSVAYLNPSFELDEDSRSVVATFRIVNHSNNTWRRDEGYSLGWQIFDPETGTFIAEGDWLSLKKDLAPAETEDVEVKVTLPPEKGRYHVYISPIHAGEGWFYQRGAAFLLVDAVVEGGKARLLETVATTLRSLRRRNLRRAIGKAFTVPWISIWTNRGLIRSMVRRDIMARYRGSFGDVLWTVLNPLLLMATYFFVFGVVLKARIGPDDSRSGFALYLLAGMLPWLPFAEAIGRAPQCILEHRNFVKKLVFPVETLPVNQVFAGLVTEAFTLCVFLIAILLARGSVPATVIWLPVLLVPQLLLTLGTSWFLSALGVYMRDLGQIIGFLIMLLFYMTPICYPETALPSGAAAILTKNPIFTLVHGYRSILLEGRAPEFHSMWKLWLLSAVVCIAGHAWFYKLRKSFADVV
jgi:lipopolysaccharide transport system permease protein